MRGTEWVGLVAGLALLSGCIYGYSGSIMAARYGPSSRPDPSYYCYDCHGYRYFDPYYDWCTNYGFIYPWRSHPRVINQYRNRYLRIRRTDPTVGRYNYPEYYRERPRYRNPRDYESWRLEQRERGEDERSWERSNEREQREKVPGKKQREKRPQGGSPRRTGSLMAMPEGVSS